ncbi:MAG: DegV family EDD domain-containing protein [Firmicutes bacterium]|nr:DegV family EDD domain-containing protein [Bacillota bacterium]
MSKITVSVDSPADFNQELLNRYNIEKAYTGIVIGDDFFLDKDLTPNDIYKAVEVDNKTPKTNAPTEEQYREIFEKYTKDGGQHIHVSISSAVSASHENAKRVAKDFKNVRVVDSKSLCMGLSFIAMKAQDLANQGKSLEEILAELENIIAKTNISFIIKDLKFLHKGGRASGLQLLGANLLKIRPSLIMNEEGKLVPGKKFKGEFAKAVKEYTAFKVEQFANADKTIAMIAFSDIDKAIVEDVTKEVKAAGFQEVHQIQAGPTITIHCGRNTIGVLFLEK